jgi:4-amino-4-deoxy-L-arabinose transferase-like glycosyltransferase
MISDQSTKKRDFFGIIILLMAGVCIGIYLIVTTGIIAKDGVTFIEYAKNLEVAPVKTMLAESQHPGYPFLILATHKITSFFYANNSVFSWIYCAQSATLLSRLFTIVILYFTGKKLFGSKLSFWSLLIFVILPKPAKYGSDVLSDWPSLCFLAAGLLLMLGGASDKRFWLFGFAGLASGIGYLIRPECVQLIVPGSLWLGLQILWHKRIMSRSRALCAVCLLIVGFLATAGPYMKLKGSLFPKKDFGLFTQEVRQPEICEESNQAVYASQFPWQNISKSFGRLGKNVGETLMWFFVPGILVGMHKWFKSRKWYEPEAFFIMTLAVLNVILMIFLYCKYGYMSYRHTLPLMMLMVLYVSIGMQEFAGWFQAIFSKGFAPSFIANRKEKFWFLFLFLAGLSISAPILLKPVRMEKQCYRATAKWLEANTNDRDIVAVPDVRIIFYAQRKGLIYKNETNPPSEATYVVKILDDKDESATAELSGKPVYKYIDKKRKGINIAVYRK